MHFVSTSVLSVLAVIGSTAILGANALGCSYVNDASTAIIKNYDEFSDTPTNANGQTVIGYGHVCKQDKCADVPYRFPISQVNAQVMLADDEKQATQCLNLYIDKSVELNENQWGALVSWTTSVGCNSVQSSTLVEKLNNGEDLNTVAKQYLPTYNKVGNNEMLALTRRRDAEVKLFQTPSSEAAFPDCPFD
ncbi:hypothetical protein GGH96_000309 [Coemansia sp. RSA 1972]|nr:hypothetical protein GGH96_000309 [Coemansia sp. RSA 1972]